MLSHFTEPFRPAHEFEIVCSLRSAMGSITFKPLSDAHAKDWFQCIVDVEDGLFPNNKYNSVYLVEVITYEDRIERLNRRKWNRPRYFQCIRCGRRRIYKSLAYSINGDYKQSVCKMCLNQEYLRQEYVQGENK